MLSEMAVGRSAEQQLRSRSLSFALFSLSFACCPRLCRIASGQATNAFHSSHLLLKKSAQAFMLLSGMASTPREIKCVVVGDPGSVWFDGSRCVEWARCRSLTHTMRRARRRSWCRTPRRSSRESTCRLCSRVRLLECSLAKFTTSNERMSPARL